MPATDDAPATAGRQRRESDRGLRRRQALLDAAVALITERGFAAVSHRTLAQRAGLPLASTTYYFSSLDDVLEQAMGQLAEQWLDRSRQVVASLPPRLTSDRQIAAAAVAVTTGLDPAAGSRGDAKVLAMYDRYLEAGRQPHLQPLVAAYNHELDALMREVLVRGGLPARRGMAPLVLAQVDGAVLRALAEGAVAGDAALSAVSSFIRILRASSG